MEKKIYSVPEVDVLKIKCDIITFSETEEWTGPIVGEGLLAEPDAP
jgi:hypothetical protein